MSALNVGTPPGDPQARLNWAINAIFTIVRHIESENHNITTDGFSLGSSTLTPLRTLDAAAGSASDVRSVLATLIDDFTKRGSKGL